MSWQKVRNSVEELVWAWGMHHMGLPWCGFLVDLRTGSDCFLLAWKAFKQIKNCVSYCMMLRGKSVSKWHAHFKFLQWALQRQEIQVFLIMPGALEWIRAVFSPFGKEEGLTLLQLCRDAWALELKSVILPLFWLFIVFTCSTPVIILLCLFCFQTKKHLCKLNAVPPCLWAICD